MLCWEKPSSRRDGRVVEGARLESVYRGNSIQGSNPCLSASYQNSIRSDRSRQLFFYLRSSKAAIGGTAREMTSATRPLSNWPLAALGATTCAAPLRSVPQKNLPSGWPALSDLPLRSLGGASSPRQSGS